MSKLIRYSKNLSSNEITFLEHTSGNSKNWQLPTQYTVGVKPHAHKPRIYSISFLISENCIHPRSSFETEKFQHMRKGGTIVLPCESKVSHFYECFRLSAYFFVFFFRSFIVLFVSYSVKELKNV